jgi:hypothetical protein
MKPLILDDRTDPVGEGQCVSHLVVSYARSYRAHKRQPIVFLVLPRYPASGPTGTPCGIDASQGRGRSPAAAERLCPGWSLVRVRPGE